MNVKRIIPLIVILLIAPLRTPSLEMKDVVILSNNIDMEAAKLVKASFEEAGAQVEIVKPGEKIPPSKLMIVMGGPMAPQVGNLPSHNLPEGERKSLIFQKGYWTWFIKPLRDKSLVIIAGHTRKETKLAAEKFVSLGFPKFLVSEKLSTLFTEDDLKKGKEFSYEWIWNGKRYTIRVRIPLNLYDFYRVKPRMSIVAEYNKTVGAKRVSDFMITWYLMARTPHQELVIKNIVDQLNSIAKNEGLTSYEKAWLTACFVQSLTYQKDLGSLGGEYPKYVVETLWDGGGDCEDTSILLISLLREMGYDTTFLLMPGHAAVAVALDPKDVKGPRVKNFVEEYGYISLVQIDSYDLYKKYLSYAKGGGDVPILEFKLDGKSYFYIETTGEGWKPGWVPYLLVLGFYPKFPIYAISVDRAPLPLIADYMTVIRKLENGVGVTLLVKVTNAGEEEAPESRLMLGITPGSTVHVGGVEPNLKGELSVNYSVKEFPTYYEFDIPSLSPGESRYALVTFYYGGGVTVETATLKIGSVNVDNVRTKPFSP